MFFLIYTAVFKLYSLILRSQHPEILDVWYRNSFRLGYWSFGKSDIDITVLLKESDNNLIKEIHRSHLKIKKLLPVIGEIVFFSENLKDFLLKTINPLELQRDPVLMEKFSLDKNINPTDKAVFLHKFLIANLNGLEKLNHRNKKTAYLMDSLQINLASLNKSEIIMKISDFCNENSDQFEKEYLHFLTNTILPGDPAPKCNAIYSLFFNKICFLDSPKNLSEFDKELLESTVLWELWGCYSNQTYENEEQLKKHISVIFDKLDSLLTKEKLNEFQEIATKLKLLNSRGNAMYYCDQLELKAIEKVLMSKKLFRYQGDGVQTECSTFEKSFATYLNTPNSILLSSGTNALVNALFTAGINEGDEVIVPAYTFFATLAAIIELKAIPIVINIDQSLSYDINELEHQITSKTKAIIIVHMDGHPADMDTLKKIAEKNNLIIIEDVAQAVGGSYKGKKLGSIGSFGCFSFNADKIISCGEGGALSINKREDFQKAFLYHDTCNQYGPTLKEFYDIEKFSGKSMRVSEIQGAMINVQLQRLEVILKNLAERYQILYKHLVQLGLTPIAEFDSSGNCHTTLRFLCTDANQVAQYVLKLNSLEIESYSPTFRPAHTVWSWFNLFSKTSKKNKFDYISSMDILSRTLLVKVSLDGTLDDWGAKIRKIDGSLLTF